MFLHDCGFNVNSLLNNEHCQLQGLHRMKQFYGSSWGFMFVKLTAVTEWNVGESHHEHIVCRYLNHVTNHSTLKREIRCDTPYRTRTCHLFVSKFCLFIEATWWVKTVTYREEGLVYLALWCILGATLKQWGNILALIVGTRKTTW